MKRLIALLCCSLLFGEVHAARPVTTPDFSSFSFESRNVSYVKVLPVPNGGFVVAGSFSVWYEGHEFKNLIRFSANGEPDTSWRPDLQGSKVFDAAITPRGVMLTVILPGYGPGSGQPPTSKLMYASHEGALIPMPAESLLQSRRTINLGQYVDGETTLGVVADGRPMRIDIDTGALSESLPVYPSGSTGFSFALFDAGGGIWDLNCGEYFGYCPAARYQLPNNFRVGDDLILFPQSGTTTASVSSSNFAFSNQHTYVGQGRFNASGQPDARWSTSGPIVKLLNNHAYFWSDEPGGGFRRGSTASDGTADANWRWTSPLGLRDYSVTNLWLPAANDDVALLMQLDPQLEATAGRPRFVATRGDTSGDVADLTIVEYYLPQIKRYFITGRKNEQDALDALPQSFQRTGMTFAAKSSRYRDIPEQPVCRMYFPPANGGSNTHFYGVGSDCATLNKLGGMKYEGYDFSVLKPTAGACPAAAPIAVTRLYNNKAASNESNHRYVVSEVSKARMLAQGWVDEGPVFCATSATDAAN